MKKVLSLVLALMMVVGMTTVAFAAVSAKPLEKVPVTFTAGNGLFIGEVDGSGQLTQPTAMNIKVYGKDAFGDYTAELTPNTDYKITTPVWKDGKVTVELQFAEEGEYLVVLKNVNRAVFDGTKYTKYNAAPVDVTVEVVVAKGGSTPSTPSTGKKYVDSSLKIDSFSDEGIFAPASNNSKKIGNGAASINKEDYFYITSEMFNWVDKNGNPVPVEPGLLLRSSHLSNVNVRKVYQKGTSGTIRDVVLQESDSRVRVRTVKFYPKTSDTDVELKLALTFKSKTSDRLEYSYNFTMENATETIEEGQTEAYSFGNYVLKAEATVRDVEFEGDEDGIVYATKTVVKGQKYYFNVDSELSDDDAQIVAENPEVDSIYTVYQNNMANATVQFKNLDREFFVYNEDGKLLGTTKDKKLPLAKKYILTTAKINFGGEEEEPTVEEPEAPPMGGGEVVEAPNTYNPNTGL